MLELCKGERGEKVVTKNSHRRKKEGIVRTSQRKERKERCYWSFSKKRKERMASLELFKREK
jgi:hypothetical protein